MANLYIGNEKIGGGTIESVNTLPTANVEEYEKHKLYLYNEDLYFLDNAFQSTPTISGVTSITNVGTKPAYAQKGNYLYLFGGDASSYVPQDTIVRFDIETKTFTTMSEVLPTPLMDFSFSQVGDYLYLFGGSKGSGAENVLKQILKIDLNDLSITTLDATSNYFYTSTATAIGEKIYIFGGQRYVNNWQYNNTILAFDTTSETLTTLATTLPIANASAFSIAKDDKIYLLAGERTDKIYVFDTTNQTLSTKNSAFSYNYFALGGFIINNFIYTMLPSGNSTTYWKYDIENDTLTSASLGSGSMSSRKPAIAIEGNIFHIINGSGRKSFTFNYNISYKKITSTDVS